MLESKKIACLEALESAIKKMASTDPYGNAAKIEFCNRAVTLAKHIATL